jgi:CRP-like cAMP-binding protein
VLFREGEPGTFAAIVVRGQLEIRKGAADQRQHVVARPGHGQMVGEMSLIDGALRSATAVAAADTEILVLARDDFDRMGQEKPGSRSSARS